jgi:hypothetical protein
VQDVQKKSLFSPTQPRRAKMRLSAVQDAFLRDGRSKVHGVKDNEVRDATKKERHVCARARVGGRPVSFQSWKLFQHPVS